MKSLSVLLLSSSLLVVPAVAQEGQGGPPSREGRGGMDMPAGSSQVLGTVTAVTADGITVQTVEGDTYQIKAGANTRVTHEREPAKLGDIKPGDGVMAFGQADAADPKILRAVFLGYQNAAEVKERMATFGKTWIAGKVTAIDGASLTLDVRRPGETATQPMTITADENTSLKRGRESITMADIHNGDQVMGRGQIKGGVFVPAMLQVRAPGEHPRGPRGGNGPGGPPSPSQGGSAPALSPQ